MPRGYHHGDLRGALLEAALRALGEDGELPSWRALALACRVSHAAPYRHFDSLEGLRAAVIEECFRRFSAHARRAVRDVSGPQRRLEVAIRAYLRFAQRHPHWYGLMFGRPVDARRYSAASEAGRAAFGLLVEAVRACGVSEPRGVAFVLWAAHHGLADLFRRGLRPEGAAAERALVDGLIRMSLDYVGAAARGTR